MIIDRYLTREVTKLVVLGCIILVVIFASISSAELLGEASAGLVPVDIVIALVLLQTLNALGLLLPTALYFSVVVALGRLYTDSEMTALSASGVSELRVLRAVFRVSLIVALFAGILAIYTRPWAYQTSYVLEAKAAAALDFSKLKAGEFYEFTRSNIIVFAQGINRKDNRLQNVFLQQNQGYKTQVISAKQAYFAPATWTSASALVFSEGFAYVLDRRGKKDMIIKFGTLRLVRDDNDDDDDSTKIGYKRKAEPTKNLARSDQPKDIAEFQWRLSTPLAAILLGLLGVPLSRSAPGQGRYARLFIAVVVYAIYFNLAGMAKTLVEQGQVGALPGVWWAHTLAIVLLVILLFRPTQRLRWWRR